MGKQKVHLRDSLLNQCEKQIPNIVPTTQNSFIREGFHNGSAKYDALCNVRSGQSDLHPSVMASQVVFHLFDPLFVVSNAKNGVLSGRIWAGHNILRFDCVRTSWAIPESSIPWSAFFETMWIFSLSGSFMVSEVAGQRSKTGGYASPDYEFHFWSYTERASAYRQVKRKLLQVVKRRADQQLESHVFQMQTLLAGRNVRPLFSANFLDTGNATSVGITQSLHNRSTDSVFLHTEGDYLFLQLLFLQSLFIDDHIFE
ncbi:hypothetical protein Tco_1391645 [Tanacetum coccineum]